MRSRGAARCTLLRARRAIGQPEGWLCKSGTKVTGCNIGGKLLAGIAIGRATRRSSSPCPTDSRGAALAAVSRTLGPCATLGPHAHPRAGCRVRRLFAPPSSGCRAGRRLAHPRPGAGLASAPRALGQDAASSRTLGQGVALPRTGCRAGCRLARPAQTWAGRRARRPRPPPRTLGRVPRRFSCAFSKGWARKGPLRGSSPHQAAPESPGCFGPI